MFKRKVYRAEFGDFLQTYYISPSMLTMVVIVNYYQ